MTINYVNTGSSPNAGDGDSLRVAFNKINANFTAVEQKFTDIQQGTTSSISNGAFYVSLGADGQLVQDISSAVYSYNHAGVFALNATADGGSIDTYPGTDFYIRTNFNDHVWEFTNDGKFVFPDGTVQLTAYTGAGGGGANTGNWGFSGNNVYNINGGSINNSSPQNPLSAYVYLPPNGGTTSVTMQNKNGNVALIAGTGTNAYTWAFRRTGHLGLPHDSSGIALIETTGTSLVISLDSYASQFKFGSDKTLTIPGDIYVNTATNTIIGSTEQFLKFEPAGTTILQSGSQTGMPVVVTASGTSTWTFNADGSVDYPNGGKLRVGQVPVTSKGQPGDKEGTVAFDGTYTYYCTADYAITGHLVTGVRAPDGAGANNGYVWVPDAPTEISSLGDITGYTISWDQGQWSTTVVQMRNDLGVPWAIETADPFIAFGPGNTYTYTSPGYTPPGDIWKRVAWSNDTW